MKPTNINIAKYFGTTPVTLSRWKTESIELNRRYKAMREYYIRNEVLKDGDSSCFEHQISEVLLKNNKDK